MSERLGEYINKGVPVDTTITISYADLIKICDNKEEVQRIIDRNFEKYMQFLATKTPKQDIEIFSTLGIITDEETLEKKFCFTPLGFLASLWVNLNVDDIARTNSISTEILELKEKELANFMKDKFTPRVELLKTINNTKLLKQEFPGLYIKYISKNKKMRELQADFNLLETSRGPLLVRLETNRLLMIALQSLGIKSEEELKKYKNYPVELFCKNYSETLQGMIDNVEEIMNYLVTHPINLGKISEHDNEKISLYLASRFLRTCNLVEKTDKQRFLYYVTNYFNENPKRKTDDKTQIEIGKVDTTKLGLKESKAEKITPKDLYEQYKKTVVDNPELHVVDFNAIDFSGMNLQEVEEFMMEYLKDLQANWELIPPSKLEDDFIVNSGYSRGELTEQEKQNKREKLINLYLEKKDFYDSTDPFFRIVGKNTFSGYIGHIYTNGTVVLDKFYENEDTKRLADEQAIYIMNISDFYRLSNLPKQQLMYNPLCKRIYHAGDWQSRVREKISDDTTTQTTATELRKIMSTGKVKQQT